MDFFQSGSSNPFANQLKNCQELEQERCMILISDWNDWKRMNKRMTFVLLKGMMHPLDLQ